MKARWLEVLTVGASVLLVAGSARAFDTGGPRLEEEKQLSGKVVRSEANILYVDHMGAIVPVEISGETRFSGVRSADQLAEGQVVRTSFTTEGGKNVADSISVGAAPAAEPATFTDQG